MLSVCRGPVQCGPARLEPLFTQPLRPDWEALFSHPGAFQRKPPAEAPRIRYTTLKTIHSASFLRHVACRGCTLIILRTQWACGIFLQKLHVACLQLKSHVFFLCSHEPRCFLHPGNYPPSHSAIAHSIAIEFLLLRQTFRGSSAPKRGQEVTVHRVLAYCAAIFSNCW